MYARFHLTDDKYENPKEPPMFCMLLRKHILGAVIESIDQLDLERIITITLRSTDEIGDTALKYIVMEVMGKHSNLMLLDEHKEKIIDSMKHIPPYQNRVRAILPGQIYVPPPRQNKLNPLHLDAKKFIKKLDFNAGKLDRQIVQILEGFSPFLAKEIVARANLGSAESYEQKFLDIRNQIIDNRFEPAIYKNDREDFHVIQITDHKGEILTFDSVNKMLDRFYSGKAERDRVKQQAKDLQKFIKNELDKNKRKIDIHQKTLQKAESMHEYQRLGELLTANLHLAQKGNDSITVIDYYDPEQKEITIPLKTNLTPSENAQAYFTKYRKLQKSVDIVNHEIEKTKIEIEYLDGLIQHIESAREDDIEEIREELRDEGYLKRQKQPKRKKETKPLPEKFTSSDGTTIYVGKNNRQNEYVTQHLANRQDVWLHTKDIPGSHVVIKDENPTEQTLLEAAQIAAYFSKAKQSSSVPVDYTHIRHVKKPKGAKPGFVIYDNEKTLFVTPKKPNG